MALFEILAASPATKPVTYTAALCSSSLIPSPLNASQATGSALITVVNATYAMGYFVLSNIVSAWGANVQMGNISWVGPTVVAAGLSRTPNGSPEGVTGTFRWASAG